MDFVGTAESPCEQHLQRSASTNTGSATPTQAVLLCVPSSRCGGVCDGCGADTPAWLSVAVTCSFSVVLQTFPLDKKHHPNDGDAFAARLSRCHGVARKRKDKHFVQIACANARERCGSADNTANLSSFTAADVKAADVSASSKQVHAVAPPPAKSTSSFAALCGCHCRPSSASRNVQESKSGGHHVCGNVNGTAEYKTQETVSVARQLPTVALLLRCSASPTHRLLVVLRPAVVFHSRHPRTPSLVYHAATWLVSASACHVAVSPAGGAVFALSNSFASVSAFTPSQEVHRAAVGGVVAEETGKKSDMSCLTLRGSFVTFESTADAPEEEKHGTILRPLAFHVGLRNSASSTHRRALRSVLRCKVSDVWCRHGFRQLPPLRAVDSTAAALSAPRVSPSVTEVLFHTSEGHVFVFQPIVRVVGADVWAARGFEKQLHTASGKQLPRTQTLSYVCTFTARLSPSSAVPSDGSQVPQFGSTLKHTHTRAGLLMAPPWRFVDVWQHSPLLTEALLEDAMTLQGAPSSDAPLHPLMRSAGEETDADVPRRRGRRHAQTVVAMSANRRVWLLHCGACLSLVTVPTASLTEPDVTRHSMQDTGERKSAYAFHGTFLTLAVAELGPRYTLHDAQYVQARNGRGGFLLLCRCCDDGLAVMPGDSGVGGRVWTRATVGNGKHGEGDGAFGAERPFVHDTAAAAKAGGLHLFFLSILAMAGAVRAGGAQAASLLPLPLSSLARCHDPHLEILYHPSARLRLVSAVSATAAVFGEEDGDCCSLADAIYVSIGTNRMPRRVWTACAHVPSLASCATLAASSFNDVGSFPRSDAAEASCASAVMAAAVQKWSMHALSAAFPSPTAFLRDRVFSPEESACEGGNAAPCLTAVSSWTAGIASLESFVERTLLTHAGTSCAISTEHAAERQRREASRHFLGVLDGLLQVFSVSPCAEAGRKRADAVSGATAVMAGFSDTLCLTGMLGCGNGNGTFRNAQDTALSASPSALLFFHRCAQLLRRTLEQLAAAGHVSAVLASVSHLMRTVRSSGASSQIADPDLALSRTSCPAALAVWRVVLQPLFDFAWGVLRTSGVHDSVTGEVLRYGSPAVQAMARTGPSWWPTQKTSAAAVAVPAQQSATVSTDVQKAVVPSLSFPVAAAVAVATADEAPGVDVPPGATPTEGIASTPAYMSTLAAYSSEELYEVVRRVFLLHGAAAALQLVEQLRHNASTRGGMTEVTAMYEAMQQRLQLAAA